MNNLTRISRLNNKIHTVCKEFLKENNVSYSHVYRNPFVKNSKKLPTHNIDGRSIKYFKTRFLTNEKLKSLNVLLTHYNVKAIKYKSTNNVWGSTSIRIVNK